MKTFTMVFVLAALVVPSCSLVAQIVRTPGGAQMMQLDAAKTLIVGEVGAIVTEEEGKVKVSMMPPPDRRPPGMASVDLLIGDEIGMANGKPVKSIKELREVYERTEKGKEFKMGVRRDGKPHIVSFEKKDQKDMPQGGQMVIRRGEGGDENSDFFPAFGIGIKKEKSAVVISEVLPHAPKEIKQGDIVQKLNGKEIKNAKDFTAEFDATKVGGELKLELLRDGKSVTVTAKRPEPRRQIIRN